MTVLGTGEAQAKLNAMGFEAILDLIVDDVSYRQIARDVGVSTHALISWIEADAERSARATAAWQTSATQCDSKATEAIESIDDSAPQGQIVRQRELASHYRWRAKARNPRVFGDKLAVETKEAEMSVQEMEVKIAQLLKKQAEDIL